MMASQGTQITIKSKTDVQIQIERRDAIMKSNLKEFWKKTIEQEGEGPEGSLQALLVLPYCLRTEPAC